MKKRENKQRLTALLTTLSLVLFLSSDAGRSRPSKPATPVERLLRRFDDSINYYRTNDIINWYLISERLKKNKT